MNLRTRERLKEFQQAAGKARERGLHVLHYSLLSNHIHMIVEAKDNLRLSAGMKSLCGRLGKKVGRFAGRFHMHVLKSPQEMKNALAYVLLNQAKHQKLLEHVDIFSSGKFFGRWERLAPWSPLLDEYIGQLPLPHYLSPPRSWLAASGWLRAGR